MPKRYRGYSQPHANQDPADGGVDTPLPAGEPRPPKKSRIPEWVKWTFGVAAGAVLGSIATRKYDDWRTGKRNPADYEPLPPMQQPALAGGAPNMTMVFPGAPMFPTAPPARANSELNPTDMNIGELKVLLKRKQAAAKARRSRAVEEEFWDD